MCASVPAWGIRGFGPFSVKKPQACSAQQHRKDPVQLLHCPLQIGNRISIFLCLPTYVHISIAIHIIITWQNTFRSKQFENEHENKKQNEHENKNVAYVFAYAYINK